MTIFRNNTNTFSDVLRPKIVILLASILSVVSLLTACQSARQDNIAQLLKSPQTYWHQNNLFSHLVIPRLSKPQSNKIHVYIEGDGRPWLNSHYVAKDPTPRYTLALNLMLQDPENSVYLGRPCYFANYDVRPENPAKSEPNSAASSSECEPWYWTHGRYSATVLTSMVESLRSFLALHPYTTVTLIGYSGGGSLAYLMAALMDEIECVVTVAGNLDIAAWAQEHDYSPLVGSLNPVEFTLPATIKQIHLRGRRDTNIPKRVLANFANTTSTIRNSHVIEYPQYDHVCCWERDWPQILNTLF